MFKEIPFILSNVVVFVATSLKCVLKGVFFFYCVENRIFQKTNRSMIGLILQHA